MKRPNCPGKQNRTGSITRRGLLVGAGAGLAAGLPLGWLGYQSLHPQPELIQSTGTAAGEYGMPGPYPGQVVEVRHREAVSDYYKINRNAVKHMMARGMCSLTGADHAQEAWRSLFQPGDVVGIKVNPVGRSRTAWETGSRQPEIGSISSFPVVIEVVRGLKSAGIPARDILLFERYADEFRTAGYEELLRQPDMQGVRWYASAAAYTDTQLAIDGYDRSGDRDSHVIGYDPDVFVSMGFAAREHSSNDDRRFRTHVSGIVTRLVNKFITIPCLKDHRSAGVTLALKNMSHGMNNNVARSHLSGIYQMNGAGSGPNQCNTFIPTAVAQEPIRRKATLHILDGLIGVYEGGPGSWNRTWAVWPRKSLFFATDPVAMDMVGWEIIDAKRAEEGFIPVARMGMVNPEQAQTMSPQLAALATFGGPVGRGLALSQQQQRMARLAGEPFDRRQPEHVLLAGLLGLGKWQRGEIEHRTHWVS
jgi:hypothetical protein